MSDKKIQNPEAEQRGEDRRPSRDITGVVETASDEAVQKAQREILAIYGPMFERLSKV